MDVNPNLYGVVGLADVFPMVVLAFNVTPEVHKAIRDEAEKRGESISVVAREFLMKGMKLNSMEYQAKKDVIDKLFGFEKE